MRKVPLLPAALLGKVGTDTFGKLLIGTLQKADIETRGLVAGILYGYDGSEDDIAKQAHYALVQELAEKFREQAGNIVCREILKNPPSDTNPTPRTAEFYKTRPCARMVLLAGQILDKYIAQNPPKLS